MHLYNDDDMMSISLFSYGRPVVFRCMGFGLGMGWVGSVIWWVGLGWVDENRPTDNSGLRDKSTTSQPRGPYRAGAVCIGFVSVTKIFCFENFKCILPV